MIHRIPRLQKLLSARAGQDGSALILVLVLITVIGLILGVTIQFAGAGVGASEGYRTQRDTTYDVDGAVSAAINSIRGSAILGSDLGSQACGPAFAMPPGQDNVPNVTVDCVPTSGSGGLADDAPPNAILTLGAGSGDGLIVTGNDSLNVDGPIYSHKAVDLTQPGSGSSDALHVNGDITAEGSCTPSASITATGLKRCNFAGTDPRGQDPGFATAADYATIAASGVDQPGTCNTNNSVVVFRPGVYTAVPKPAPNCNGNVWWFAPQMSGATPTGQGVYYFDFQDPSNVWNFGNTTVVGGTPNGWNANTNSSNSAFTNSTQFKSVCDPTSYGVQFIVGGGTRMNVTSQDALALCGSRADDTSRANYKQRIAFYALTAGSHTPSGATTWTPGSESTPASPGDSPFVFTPDAAGGPFPATATLTHPNNTGFAGSASFSNFGSMPSGAALTPGSRVQLTVKHAEPLGPDNKVTMKLTMTDASTPAGVDYTVNACPDKNQCSQTIDITNDLDPIYPYKDLNSIKVTYQVTGTKQAASPYTNRLDGLSLSLDYMSTGFEAVRCPSGTPGCDLFASTVNQNLFFKGTVYAPTASFNVNVHNNDTTIFNRGIIVRRLIANASASSKQTDSPFQIPKTGSSSRQVIFTGKINGVPRIRALVTYEDVGVNGAAFPGYTVTVNRWDVLRCAGC